MNEEVVNNSRTLGSVLDEIKAEFQQFVKTRIAIFKTEIDEKIKLLRIAFPLVAIAILLLSTAYLLFTLALVGLIGAFLPNNSYRWCFAFAAVAVLWSIAGVVTAYLAKRELELKRLIPEKTIAVLREDKIWIESEVKN